MVMVHVVPGPGVMVTESKVLALALKQLRAAGGYGSPDYREIAEALDWLVEAQRASARANTPNATAESSDVDGMLPTVCADDPSWLTVTRVVSACGLSATSVRKHELHLGARWVKPPGRKPELRYPADRVAAWIASRTRRVA